MQMVENTADFGDVFNRALQESIKDSLQQIYENKKAELIADLNKERERIVANAAISVSTMMSVQRVESELVIRIVKEEKK